MPGVKPSFLTRMHVLPQYMPFNLWGISAARNIGKSLFANRFDFGALWASQGKNKSVNRSRTKQDVL